MATTVATSMPSLRRQLDRHLHVHVVAGIVAVEADDALAAIGLTHGVVEALGGRGGEQFADRHRIQHVPAGIADEGRLMSGTAAGNDADLAGDRRVLRNDHPRVVGKPDEIGMRLDEALDGIFDHFVGVVDESLHDVSSSMVGFQRIV